MKHSKVEFPIPETLIGYVDFRKLYEKAFAKIQALTSELSDAKAEAKGWKTASDSWESTAEKAITKASLVEPEDGPGVYMVHCNPSGSVFVKTLPFFRYQDGFSAEWGKAWKPVVATGLEDARRLACAMFPNARPWSEQPQRTSTTF